MGRLRQGGQALGGAGATKPGPRQEARSSLGPLCPCASSPPAPLSARGRRASGSVLVGVGVGGRGGGAPSGGKRWHCLPLSRLTTWEEEGPGEGSGDGRRVWGVEGPQSGGGCKGENALEDVPGRGGLTRLQGSKCPDPRLPRLLGLPIRSMDLPGRPESRSPSWGWWRHSPRPQQRFPVALLRFAELLPQSYFVP